MLWNKVLQLLFFQKARQQIPVHNALVEFGDHGAVVMHRGIHLTSLLRSHARDSLVELANLNPRVINLLVAARIRINGKVTMGVQVPIELGASRRNSLHTLLLLCVGVRGDLLSTTLFMLS